MYYVKSLITGKWIEMNGKRAKLSEKMKRATETFMMEQGIRHIEFYDSDAVDSEERLIDTYYAGTNPND